MENKSLKNGDIVSFEHNGKKLVGIIVELSYKFSYKVKVGHDHYIVNISDLESDKPVKKAGRPPKDSNKSKDKKETPEDSEPAETETESEGETTEGENDGSEETKEDEEETKDSE